MSDRYYAGKSPIRDSLPFRNRDKEEYDAKWAAANKKVAERNNPASRRKATMDCTVMGVDYLKGDLMPMPHYRIMKTMQQVME